LDSVANSDLESLEKLRMERSQENPFATKMDFDRWADNVKAVIACDPKARRQFNNYAAQVESMYAFKSDPLNAINGVIGVVNQVATQWRIELSKNVVEKPVEIPKDTGVDKVSDKGASKIVDRFWTWLKKFADTTISKVAASMITAWLIYLIGTHFGIFLKSGG
jgi:hypothetical protein